MDTELVIRAQHGDKEAFTRLAGAMTASFLSIAHRILRDIDAAEDATQQALLNVWQRLPQLRDPERFQAWSYRLLVRSCYDERRTAARRASPLRLLAAEDAFTDDSRAVLDRDQLERAFRRLSLEHRTVVVFRHYLHMSVNEVAQALGVPAGTVDSRLHYAMRELRAALEADARPGEPRIAS